ncbi:MAG: arcadin 1 [Pyrobaculum sp.]|jgi:hypothetical protein
MQVLSVYRAPSSDCINVDVGYEESLMPVLGGEKPMQQAVQQALQLVQYLMPSSTTRKVIKATLCLSDEEYEVLRKPTVGDEVDLSVSNEGVVTIRFIKR